MTRATNSSSLKFVRNLAAFAAVVVVCAMSLPAFSQHQLQTRHVREVVTSGKAKLQGALPATQRLKLAISLPLRDEAELDQLLQQLYDPQSPLYHQFLSVEEFTARFGPTEADYEQVMKVATENGLTITAKTPNRMVMDVEGSVEEISRTFHVNLNLYQHPSEDRTFYAADREPTLDSNIEVWHISGLDNYSLPLPHLKSASSADYKTFTTGSGPGGQFIGSDFRAAYYGGTILTGAGQSIGIFGLNYQLSDIELYFKNIGQSFNPSILQNYSTDGTTNTCNGCDDGEPVIDIISSYSMAPGVSSVIEYFGSYDVDTFEAMASHNVSKQLSCSLGWEPSDPTADEPIFKEFAAQGQNLFVSSGDSGAYALGSSDFSYPAEDPYVTAVGGTDLATNGAGGSWASETAWGGSSGGPAPDGYGIPSWQVGAANSSNDASTTIRNVPDVAAEGNTDNYFCDNGSCSGGLGGTSFAAPRWAGFLALANQQAAENGKSIGFINSTIYSSYFAGINYESDFHDIVNGNNNNGKGQSYNAVTGYDLVTGLGSPNGQSLINLLAGPVPVPTFTISDSPNSLTIAQGASGTSTVTIASQHGFNSSTSLSIAGLPAGVTASFSPSFVTPSSNGSATTTLTLTAGATATAGTVTVTVTGVSGSLSQSATIALTVNETIAPGSPEISGIYTDGASFSTGGVDGDGYAYSSSQLGTSLSWTGTTFTFGAANSPDAYSSETVALPSGQYGLLKLLATGVNGDQPAQTFIVTYSDGTTTSFTQSLSDWYTPQNYSGESIAKATSHRDASNGTEDNRTFNLYGYAFTLNTAKTLKSITLPNNRDVVVLAIVPVETYNVSGIYTDGTSFTTGGLDNDGYAYSSNQLGAILSWNGTAFPFGAVNAPNVYSAGATIELAAGQFNTLELLATGVNGNQIAQNFTVTYTDGTTTTITQSLSDWYTPQNYSGESIAKATSHRNASNGTEDNRTFNLYGYAFPINSAKTVQSVALPNNRNVIVLAAVPVTSSAASSIFINAGGPAVKSFTADEYEAGGGVATTGNSINVTGVNNVAPEAVYRSERAGVFTYTIPGFAAGSSHGVTLHFAEFYWNHAGQRVFNVAINGTPVLSNFDIVAEAGTNTALVKQFTTTANASGQIVISFTAGTADQPKISGIQIQ